MTNLGKRVQQLRIEHRWNRSELARAAGMSATEVRFVESGVRPDPQVSTVIKLAMALDVSVDYLVGKEKF